MPSILKHRELHVRSKSFTTLNLGQLIGLIQLSDVASVGEIVGGYLVASSSVHITKITATSSQHPHAVDNGSLGSLSALIFVRRLGFSGCATPVDIRYLR
ncbi:hypothetical protein Moror_5574 [Moniliophthora roreri MCA 2997]|uniref:Uncharacterized protein n=1 Tax=Moniliophthora roreri (strain MCA 2997) TaxID=1381753 RepID=V2WMV2_MONRO|nr:hypothetical protein Moror_5574 [Moniliophthora roreri MCA 2997]